MQRNTGIPYEILVKNIYENMLNREDVRQVEVKHDYQAKGKSATHQIDVYWCFEVGGTQFETFVSCKDWARNVDMHVVRELDSAINDVPGHPHGIIITRTGIQEGALEFALNLKFDVFQLRPTDAGEKFVQVIPRYFAEVGKCSIEFDTPWIDKKLKKQGLTPSQVLRKVDGIDSNIGVYDDSNKKVGTLHSLKKELARKLALTLTMGETPSATPQQIVKHTFTEPTYMHNDGDRHHLPQLKVLSISFADMQVKYEPVKISMGIEDVVSHIIKDVQSNVTGLIDNNLKIINYPWR